MLYSFLYADGSILRSCCKDGIIPLKSDGIICVRLWVRQEVFITDRLSINIASYSFSKTKYWRSFGQQELSL
jgi:hypothetical protein